jgi:hypothetical protein
VTTLLAAFTTIVAFYFGARTAERAVDRTRRRRRGGEHA